MNLKNCPRCGKLFMPSIKDVCPNCIREIDQQYDKCYKYLKENRGASMQDLHEGTDVSVKQIMKFIRDGRISIANMPNLSYSCDSCGTQIRDGHLCDNCRSRLSKDVSHTIEDQHRAEELRKQEMRAAFKIDDRLRRDR